MRELYYRLLGKVAVPCRDVEEWARAFEGRDRIVAKTDVGTMRVSTVFLGINHRFGPGDPLLFETMIFDDGDDGYQERYSTWGQAEEGHAKAVKYAEEQLVKAMVLLNQKVEREC